MQHATKPRQLSQSDSVVLHGELPRNMSRNSCAGAYYVYIHIPTAGRMIGIGFAQHSFFTNEERIKLPLTGLGRDWRALPPWH